MIEKRTIISTKAEFKKLREQCFLRDANQCQVCGYLFPKNFLHPHHIIPRGRLHVDHIDNLLTTCFSCHAGVHRHIEGYPSVDELIERYRTRIERFL